jgi:hypothetical protein
MIFCFFIDNKQSYIDEVSDELFDGLVSHLHHSQYDQTEQVNKSSEGHIAGFSSDPSAVSKQGQVATTNVAVVGMS